MSLYLKKFVQDAAIGIWEISESVEELYRQINLSEDEEHIFSCLKTPTRKQHWLSYRLILPFLVHENELSAISYDEYGKPYLNNGVRHISVSHSGKFSALIASPTHSVGIDIEHIEDKILNISHKFLNDKEIKETGTNPSLESLYVIWAAKEALYKLHGKRNILFREHLYIEPFTCDDSGVVFGSIDSEQVKKTLGVHYQIMDDYILAYAIDK
jgi:4'-phosphopantetheinyl transferase